MYDDSSNRSNVRLSSNISNARLCFITLVVTMCLVESIMYIVYVGAERDGITDKVVTLPKHVCIS